MELVADNFRAFQCSLLDYENILTVYRSRPHVQGSIRTIKSDEDFERILADILLDKESEYCVLAVEDLSTNNLISFSIYSFPKASQFGFLMIGGTLPKDRTLPESRNSGAVALLRLGVMIGEQKNVFDIFMSVKLSAYLPFCLLINSYEEDSNEEHRTYWLLHKIVQPADCLTTTIEKYLLGQPLVDRIYPVAIIHLSVKEKFRIEHFKHNFSVSEKTLMRCTVPTYACSTSTITSPGTSS
jgi:hypothetical protein